MLLFDAIGIGFLAFALREWTAWRRYGEVEAVLDPWPGAIGGDIAGHFALRRPLDPNHRIRVELTCESRRRGHKQTIIRPIWTQSLDLEPMLRGEQQLWFHFEVPADLPAAEPASGDYHLWRLTLDVTQPGADLQRKYEIPAFPGDARNASARRSTRIDPNPQIAEVSRLMNIYQRDDRVTLDYKAGRNWKIALPLMLFGLISIGSGGFLVTEGGLGGSVFSIVPWIMAAVFVPIGVAMMLGSLWSLGHRRIVLIDPTEVATRVFCFGQPIYTRSVPRDLITQMYWTRTGTMQSGRKTAVWYALFVRRRDGKPLRIGDGFESEQAVRIAAERLSELTGVALPPDQRN